MSGVIVAGIKVIQIFEVEHLFDLLRQGNANRTQHPTDANAESSRSHAVFQVRLHFNRFPMIDMKITIDFFYHRCSFK